MRRGLFIDKQRNLVRRVEREHEAFQVGMLSLSAEEVYHRCNEIRFYECVYEFFVYCDSIETEYLEACLAEPDVLVALWEIYNKYEYLRADRWEDVKELLRVLVMRQGGGMLEKTDGICHQEG